MSEDYPPPFDVAKVTEMFKNVKSLSDLTGSNGSIQEMLIQMQSLKDLEEAIVVSAKSKFLRTDAQHGLLQKAGRDLKQRFPSNLAAITRAYDELSGTDKRFPQTSKFIELMREFGEDWPKLS